MRVCTVFTGTPVVKLTCGQPDIVEKLKTDCDWIFMENYFTLWKNSEMGVCLE